ncbi:MAG: SGNH/GDSL hydrolase family protein [Akkermansiaceae bacterium]|nr:SGNH/GDSL hydrolase family protein [Akkermansiaceae bacterium]
MRLFIILISFLVMPMANADHHLLEKNRRILMLGDSITQGGHYVHYLDAWLVKKFPDRRYEVINAGVSSETISGLSEKGHAGGRFPRPCLFERLERVLAKTRPQLIIACYGMNCGIYQPLDPQRSARFQNGHLRLRAAAKQYGAEVLHVTPPIYDNHGKPGFNYNSVLTAYSKWMAQQTDSGWLVADLHTFMSQKIAAEKTKDKKFTVQRDRVHPDKQGHWIMAQAIISYFGDTNVSKFDNGSQLLAKKNMDAVVKRSVAFQKAIHAETKPLRPGVPQGGTLSSARELAKTLETDIYQAP